MLADLEARLPDRYPPQLSALFQMLAFEDGREEGSSQPNFLSPAEIIRLQLRSMAVPNTSF
jgi:hypothetical protein